MCHKVVFFFGYPPASHLRKIAEQIWPTESTSRCPCDQSTLPPLLPQAPLALLAPDAGYGPSFPSEGIHGHKSPSRCVTAHLPASSPDVPVSDF